ncbi:MAG: hypothetical protein V1875_02985 [Candidatus Altiarchaeota archaeon]
MSRKKKDAAVEDLDEKVEEKQGVDEEKAPAQAPVAAQAPVEEEEFSPEDEAKYVFPMAPIVRLMKQEMDGDKMIRRRVKEGMNVWLESLCRKVARKMNQSEYTMVEIDDFKTAIEAYEMIDSVEQEKTRIVANLEKIKQDCDSLIMDVNRKFVTP